MSLTDAMRSGPNPTRATSGADGTVVWATVMPAMLPHVFIGDYLDAGSDRVLWTGLLDGTIPTASGDVSSVDGEWTRAVVSLDLDGNIEWAYTFVGSASVRNIAVDPCGGGYVYGDIEGTADFGTAVGQGGYDDPFLVHLNEDGTPDWVRVYHDDGNFEPVSVAVDSEGSALLTGGATSLDVDGTVVGGGSDLGEFMGAFVAKINRHGDVLWATDFDSLSSESSDVTVDALDNPIVVGEFSAPITIGDFSFVADSPNIFLSTMEP